MLNEPAPPESGPAPRPPLWRRLPYREALIVAAVFIGVQLWQARDMASGAMPVLEGTLADGRRGSLAATLAAAGGRPVLVYVWASWCPICRVQEGTVGAIAEDWPVLTLAMQSGGVGEVAKFAGEHGLAYPILVDEQGALAAGLGVRGVPAWFVVDAAQRIRFAGTGYTSSWGLRLRLWWASVRP